MNYETEDYTIDDYYLDLLKERLDFYEAESISDLETRWVLEINQK